MCRGAVKQKTWLWSILLHSPLLTLMWNDFPDPSFLINSRTKENFYSTNCLVQPVSLRTQKTSHKTGAMDTSYGQFLGFSPATSYVSKNTLYFVSELFRVIILSRDSRKSAKKNFMMHFMMKLKCTSRDSANCWVRQTWVESYHIKQGIKVRCSVVEWSHRNQEPYLPKLKIYELPSPTLEVAHTSVRLRSRI